MPTIHKLTERKFRFRRKERNGQLKLDPISIHPGTDGEDHKIVPPPRNELTSWQPSTHERDLSAAITL